MLDGENHNLQEYTYKKITPCDVCSQVLRGMYRTNGYLLPSNHPSKEWNRDKFSIDFVFILCHCRWMNVFFSYFLISNFTRYRYNGYCMPGKEQVQYNRRTFRSTDVYRMCIENCLMQFYASLFKFFSFLFWLLFALLLWFDVEKRGGRERNAD